MAELFPVLMAYLDRCYVWVVPEPRVYGYKLPNGSWEGVIGLVARGEADLSVPLSITTERLAAVDFTEPVFIDEFAIAYKLPSLKSDIRGFIKPFSPVLWLLMLFAAIIVCVSTWFVLRSYAAHGTRLMKDRKRRDSRGDNARERAVERSLLWTMCHLINQPSCVISSPSPAVPWEPTGYAPRILGGLWLLVAFILGVVYRGNLKAMLILPTLELPFNNLQELADSDEVIWSPGSHIAHQLLMAAPPDSLYGSLAKKTFVELNIPAGIQRTYQGKHAVITLMSAIIASSHDTFSKTGNCKIFVLPERFLRTTSMGILTGKGSNLKPKLDKAIKWIKEFGITEQLIRNKFSNGTNCVKPPTSNTGSQGLRALDIVDFFGVFVIYISGILLSGGVFVAEVIVKKMDSRDHRGTGSSSRELRGKPKRDDTLAESARE
ncbi:glutamate receptor-like [Penaeus vannamei]|uniref:glutamate receptor-like n=1 Tax=Penaeus vannamei TaxID=6689 RepID=UPI00387F4CDC